MHKAFSVRDDRGDGLDLRALRYGQEEVSSRIYFAVRDRWWRTVPLTVHSRHVENTPTGFRHAIEAVTDWDSHPARISLRYVAEGSELVADFRATALGAFSYRRIGFCLLFGDREFAGRPAVSWLSGAVTDVRFPVEIVTRDQFDPASVQFHRRFDRFATSLASGTRIRYDLEGEEFEFEDQRNWTDASFKAYSTSHSSLYTVEGQSFVQRVRIQIEPVDVADDEAQPADRTIHIGAPTGVMPPIDLFRGRVSARSYRPGGGFQELNSQRPDAARMAAYDSIELAINGAVHAADDDSVQETTSLHGHLVRQVHAAFPGLPLRLAPVSFLDVAGDWRDEAGQYRPEPAPGPLPPRLLSPFAATWAVASAARVLPAAPDLVHYFNAALPPDSPAARTVAALAALHGRPLLAVSAPPPLAALAVALDATVTLAVANPSPDRVWFQLPDGGEATLDGFASAWFTMTKASLE